MNFFVFVFVCFGSSKSGCVFLFFFGLIPSKQIDRRRRPTTEKYAGMKSDPHSLTVAQLQYYVVHENHTQIDLSILVVVVVCFVIRFDSYFFKYSSLFFPRHATI